MLVSFIYNCVRIGGWESVLFSASRAFQPYIMILALTRKNSNWKV